MVSVPEWPQSATTTCRDVAAADGAGATPKAVVASPAMICEVRE